MMKLKKILSLILVTATVCVMLTGCKALDKAKKNHAYYTDKTKKQVELDGEIYKILPECKDFNPAVDYVEGHHTVSQKDVPILITLLGAQEGLYSAGNDELLVGNYTDSKYARSDVYGKYVKLIEDYKLDTYAYWKSEYKDGRYTSRLTRIDKEDVDLITAAEAAGEQTEMPERIFEKETYDLTLMMSDEKTMMFSRNWLNIIYCEEDKTAYLQFIDRGVSFKASEEYAGKLFEIIKKYNQVYYDEGKAFIETNYYD